jgi:hypothetical protein
MKRSILPLLCVLGLCVAPGTTPANDIEPGKEFYTVISAPRPIVLDGSLSEWSGVPVLADPKFAVPKYSGTNANPNYVLFEPYQGGTWTGPDDQTSAVQICYDADNVYFGFVVTDDYHENAANSAWNGDSVQLMIADAARTNIVALYNYALGGVEDALGSVIVEHERGPACIADGTCLTEAVVTRNTNTHKTTYEIKLPKAALGLTTLKGGPQFGLGMAINDGDAGAGQNGQKGWGGLGAHSIVFMKTPQETALISLAKGNDIEPGKEYYTALRTTNNIVLDGVLSEWTGAPVLADPKFAVPKYSGTNDNPNYVLFEPYQGGTWTGPDDQTSAVQIVYDATNVYFGFVVTDDYHENAANSAWNGDSVQLMIADAARTNIVALYNYALGGVEGTLGNVIVEHERGPACIADGTCLTEAVVTRNATTHKTIYEIKLPVGSLGLTGPLTAGAQFGLGMAINDGDSGAGQNGQKGWGGLGAHSIVFMKTPQETALVTLGTTVSGSDTFFLSSINQTFNSFTFRATDKGVSIVDPTSVRLTIDNQLVTVMASPKTGDSTDFTHRRASPFPPNSNHSYTIQVKDTLGNTVTAQGTFKTDNYTLDKLHSYYAQIRSSAALTSDRGGHTGQAGDSALDFGTGTALGTSALVEDATFLNANASNDVMTVSVWIKKHDNVSSSAFWAESPSSPGSRGLQANVPNTDAASSDEIVVFDVGGNTPDDSEISASISTFPDFTGPNWWTNWHHWVFIQNGTTKQIWTDGKLFLEGAGLTALPTDFSRLWLGAAGGGQGGAVANMHGLIDDFAVFGTALTSAQVTNLFTGTLPSALPASTRPLAYWDFNATAATGSGSILTSARSGNNLTISWTPPGGTLESATSLGGTPTWGAVGTNNPASVTIGAGNTFYRVRQ